MRNFFSLSLILGLSFVLSACKSVEIKDGKVPDEYMSQAKKFEGAYKGRFENREGELIVSFTGNIPRVSFRGLNGSNDLLGDNCKSSIALLKSVDTSTDGKRVKRVYFGFNPGKCKASGRQLMLSFDGDTNQIKAEVEATATSYVDCMMVDANAIVTTDATSDLSLEDTEGYSAEVSTHGRTYRPPHRNFPRLPRCRTKYMYSYYTGQFKR